MVGMEVISCSRLSGSLENRQSQMTVPLLPKEAASVSSLSSKCTLHNLHKLARLAWRLRVGVRSCQGSLAARRPKYHVLSFLIELSTAEA